MTIPVSPQPPPPAPGQRPLPAPPAPLPYDGVSIAALVCAITCCAAPVAVVLGFVGLVRTTGGHRRGLWAAVTGLALGMVGSVVLLGALIGGTLALFSTSPDDAAVLPGDCLEVTRAFDGTDLWWADCYGPHDGEVLAAGTLGREAASKAADLTGDAWCREVLDADLLALVREQHLTLSLRTDSLDAETPEAGDPWFCWAEPRDHRTLEEPLVDRGYGPTPPEEA